MLKYFTTLKNSEITSIAIGGFDGIHIGHQKLIEKLDENGILFVIDKGYSNLTPEAIKCKYVKNGCIFVDLKDIKDLSPLEFIEFLKKIFPNLKRIIVGYDFSFGKDRNGDTNLLKKYFEVEIIDEVIIDGISVHSKIIREYLKKGNIQFVNKLLGRPYRIIAKTMKGQGIGREKLVSTINLQKSNFLLPKEGVYATKTKVKNKWYISATFIGKRESVDGNFAIETHLIDSYIDFLPDEVEVVFYDFVRDNKKFDTLRELKNQILKDISYIKDFFDKK